MSMELYVLSDRELNSISQWQAAIDAEGYPLRLASDVQLESHSGFLPAHLREELTGCECDHFPADEFLRETRQEMPDVAFGQEWKFVLAFRWGRNFNELQAAWMAAVAYAAATDGVILDDQEAKVRTVAEGRALVGEIVDDMPKVEAIMRELDRSRP